MNRSIEPRQVELDAARRWRRDGLRLLWRVSSGWVLAWLAIAGVLVASMGLSAWVLILPGLSAPAFDLHVLMLDRAAQNRYGARQAMHEAWDWLWGRRWIYLRCALVRIAGATAILAVYAGLIVAMSHGRMETTGLSQMPPWQRLFDIPWPVWAWAGLLPAVGQRGGMTSFRPWLVRRLGAGEAEAALLQGLARRRNPHPMLSLLFWQATVGWLALIFFPMALPVADVYMAAVMRCAWCDLFEGNTGIQAETTPQTARPVAVAPTG